MNVHAPDTVLKDRTQLQIYRALKEADPDALNQTFHALFPAIPHDWGIAEIAWPTTKAIMPLFSIAVLWPWDWT